MYFCAVYVAMIIVHVCDIHTPLIIASYKYTCTLLIVCLSLNLAESVCNSSGFGFNGFSEDGKEKWDLVNIMDIHQFELGNNPRAVTLAWNIPTTTWVRRYNKSYFIYYNVLL